MAVRPGHFKDAVGQTALWAAVVTAQTSLARRAAVEEALRSLDRAAEAAAVLAREGLTVPAPKGGMVHVHPLLKAERDAREQFARIWRGLRLQF